MKCDACDNELEQDRCPTCIVGGLIAEASGRRPRQSGAPVWLHQLAAVVGSRRPVHWDLVRRLLVEFIRLWVRTEPSRGKVAGEPPRGA